MQKFFNDVFCPKNAKKKKKNQDKHHIFLQIQGTESEDVVLFVMSLLYLDWSVVLFVT